MKFFSRQALPHLRRRAPEARESRAVKVHGKTHRRAVAADHRRRAASSCAAMPLTATEAKIATELLKEIRSRLGFLRERGARAT